MIPENILRIGDEEAALRARSLSAISDDREMADHLAAVEAAMTALMDHIRERLDRSHSELVIQKLGIRLFNDLASALSQAFSGYYQKAYDALRDALELQFLFDDFADDSTKVGRWETATKRDREREFGARPVRERLDARYAHADQKRRHAYQELSTFASHASPEGFMLISPKGDAVIGPFFDPRFLRAFLRDAAQHGLASTVNFTALLPAGSEAEMHAKRAFVARSAKWIEVYMGEAVAAGFTSGGGA